MQVRVPKGGPHDSGLEMTSYLSREAGVPAPRSKLGTAVVAVRPGIALVVRVGDQVTLLPWSVVNSVSWSE